MERQELSREEKPTTRPELVFSVESSTVQMNSHQNTNETVVASAHTIDHDSWKQVGVLLVLSFNNGYILTFSNLILVPLGWIWGSVCLVVFGAFTAYANWLLAGFHILDGQRFIRYRDLMGFVFGKQMYYITWILQFLTLILSNMGFILIGGRALKEIDFELSGSTLRLQYFIIIAGVAFFVFSFLVPNISAMRGWLGLSTVATIIFVVGLMVILGKDGISNKNKDYTIQGKSEVDKAFNAFSSIATIVVCNTSGLLPEIQSTLRKPAMKNMKRALSLQYTAGLAVYYGVTITGYWAYGSSASDYIPKELSGPKWTKILINSMVFLQIIVSQHLFIAPVHETLDTSFLKVDESAILSMENLFRRCILRALVFTVNTFAAAALPFIGDFVSLLGSFALFPLTFVFPSMIFIKVRDKTARKEQKAWHWANIFVFSILTLATTVSAVYLGVPSRYLGLVQVSGLGNSIGPGDVTLDSWRQVGVLLVLSFNNGYILTFSNLILVPLGWIWGSVCLVVFSAFTAYANWFLAGFHILDGRRKTNVLHHLDSAISNSHPHQHGLHTYWGESIKGISNKNKDYTIQGKSEVDKVFNALSSIATIVVCNTTGLLPELQSTLRRPAVKNMKRALSLQYTAGLALYYGVTITGYWAYGSSASDYIPKELSGPKWAKILINSMVFLQIIVSQQLFIAPVHETLDTSFLKVDESANLSMENLFRRCILRALVFTVNTFAAAALPFIGDFVSLIGSFALFLLTFVFPSMIFIKVRYKTARKEQKVWHWANIVLFSILTLATTVSAVRLIVKNARTYRLFADT
ncbi:hypothetical protein Sjap_016317 [Stephania japonica]|uniref:Amino acid transporter transmembrane domain-containing protein n=1 Tax=Stephania japonica TaxID=461633 RepID=A0AAP0NTN9_9MAGN